MSKNCPKCGNPLDEGALFCDNCGLRLNAQPQQPPRPNVQPQQTHSQPYAQPQQQYPQQSQQYAPYQPPYRQNQSAPQPPKKKKTGLIIGLICGGTALLIAAVLVVIFVVMPMLKKPGGDLPPKPLTTATEHVTKQVPELTTAMPKEPKTAIPTEAPTEPQTAPPTQAPTQPPTQPKAELPYENSLGSVKPTDFTWISDAKSGMKGSFISRDDLVGKWKGMFKYDGIWELVYVTIDTDSTVTVQPDQINYGDGWESEAGDAPYIFSGGFDVDRVYGTGEYGKLDLYQFLETGGTQYAQGKLNASKTGMEAEVYLVRP